MSATDFVNLVLANIGAETDAWGISRIPEYAAQAVNSFSAPANRPALLERWERGLRALLNDAEPGSDAQLTFARSYAAASRSDIALTDLEQLLDGELAFGGLAVDQDLRWTLISSLARRGRAADRIETELAADTTISGRERAAAARAGQPSAEAKAEAWEAAIVRSD
ncbi:MAG: ERAP1-like C-terminal domain-containing protein, partial [Planctomycetota bacterium]|nr:ERAP1-like C-terminal domain-containing protein [Planctomycetota bacterium]